MNKTQLFLILALHAYSLSAQMVTQRQTTISNVLYETTELPDDLIKIIVNYDSLFASDSGSVLDLIVLSHHRLIATYQDLSIRVWDIQTGACSKIIKHKTDISAITVLPHNEIAVGEGDKSIKIWNVETGICRKVLRGRHQQAVVGLVALPNKQLASASDEPPRFWFFLQKSGIIILWNTETGAILRTITTPRSIRRLWPTQIESLPLAIATDIEKQETAPAESNSVFITVVVHGISFLDPETNSQFAVELKGLPSNISSFVSLDPSSTNIVIGGDNQKLHFHTVHENKQYSPFWIPTLFSSFPIVTTLLTPHKLASGGWSDHKIRIINTESAECHQELDVTARTTALAALSENDLAVGSDDGKIEIIDITAEKNNKS